MAYKGNTLLRDARETVALTREQLVEYLRCADDPCYFFRTHVQIVTLNEGRTQFVPYPYQEQIVDIITKSRFTICLLPRQMGKTTVVAGLMLHYAIFNPDKFCAVLANKGRTARSILSRIKNMYELLPPFLQPGVTEWNKGSVKFGNGSSILAEATSATASRGESVNFLLLDEFAHVQQQEEFWTSVYPVISAGEDTKVVIISTPNGLDLFYKIYADAEEGKNEFRPVKVHWSEHPDRDENWKRVTLSNIGEERFRQEYECEFIGSTNTLISGRKLEQLRPAPLLRTSATGVRVYEEPQPNILYYLVADVARGVGNDASAFSVFKISRDGKYEQVAAFHNTRTRPAEFAAIIYETAKEYNDAYVLVEINDLGEQVTHALENEYEYYEQLVYSERRGKLALNDARSAHHSPGLRTTQTVKRVGALQLKRLVEENILLLRDSYTISELFKFVKTSSGWSGSGAADDLVMTAVLFAYAVSSLEYRNYLAQLSQDAADAAGENDTWAPTLYYQESEQGGDIFDEDWRSLLLAVQNTQRP